MRKVSPKCPNCGSEDTFLEGSDRGCRDCCHEWTPRVWYPCPKCSVDITFHSKVSYGGRRKCHYCKRVYVAGNHGRPMTFDQFETL